MAKYIGYARVSGSSQDNRRQEVYLHARAVEHGLPLEIFQEKKSGASLDRQVKEIIERLQPGDILGFWITSRFGRPEPEDVGVYFEWAKQARSKGATIEIDKKVLNTTTVDGVKKFLDELLEAYNERIAILARTRDGKLLARSDGEYRGFGWMPWGFRKCIRGYDENGEPIRGYEHHPEQVEIVKDLYQWIIDGKKLADFQSMIMARGEIKTARGKVREWHKGSLQYMLFNPLNMGFAFARAGDANRLVAKNLVMSHLGDMSIFVKATLYPPIVSSETYWKAVETYTINRRAVYTGNMRTGEDVFTRTVYCRWCHKHGKSSAFYVNHAKRRDETKAYYQANNIVKGCPNYRSIRAGVFQTMFNLALDFLFQDYNEIDLYISEQLSRLKNNRQEATLAAIDRQIEELQSNRLKWKENMIKTDDPDLITSWLSKIDSIEMKIRELKSQRNTIVSEEKEKEVLKLRADFHKNTWLEWQRRNLDTETRREIKSKLIKSGWMLKQSLVFIFKNSKVVSFRLPYQGPGYRNKNVFPFSVGFMGRLQVFGTVDLDNKILVVEASKSYPEEIRDAVRATYCNHQSTSASNKYFLTLGGYDIKTK